MFKRLATLAAAGAASLALVAAPAITAAPSATALAEQPPPARSAAIPGALIRWAITNYQCNNEVTTGYIGDVAYQYKSGLFISYLRTYHYLQKWNGSSWVTKTYHYYNKANPSNNTYYYSPSRFQYQNWFPVANYGAGYYRVYDYFVWYNGASPRASRTLTTSSCYLS